MAIGVFPGRHKGKKRGPEPREAPEGGGEFRRKRRRT